MGLSPDNGAIFMQVMRQMANPFVFVMASSAVLLAIISTASAILLALSSNAAQDMTSTPAKGRVITLLIGAGAALGPYLGNDIISWMVGSYEISVGALFVPIVIAVFAKRATLPTQAAWSSAVLGALGTIISHQDSSIAVRILAPFVLSSLGFAAGLWIARRQNKMQAAAAVP